MICTVLHDCDLEGILEVLQDPWVEMAEIRLDSCRLSADDIDELFGTSDKPLIATCPASACKDSVKLLERAARAGAQFLDLELDAPAATSKFFRTLCEECGVRLIRSYHDMEGTPPAEFLQQVADRCRRYGADVAKIAVSVPQGGNARESLSVISRLYDNAAPGTLVAFVMGEEARDSRLECLRRGAPFTYCATDEDSGTAPGQWPLERMHEAVYGDAAGFFRNGVRMPASKSFAQRAVIAAALAEGTSHLGNYSPCADSEAAIAVARKLGAKVRKGAKLSVTGIGPIAGPMQLGTLHVGESGLLARLMIPLSALLGDGRTTITGEKTLVSRPLEGVSDIMASFGVLVKDSKVPLDVTGHLIAGNAEIDGKGGSQLISGLLMALPLASKPSKMYVSDPKSLPYMFITMDVLRKFGIGIRSEMEGDEQLIENEDWSGCTEICFKIKGDQKYRAADFDMEGDWSGAAAFLAAGAIFGSVELDGLDSKSLQADLSMLDVLAEAGVYSSQDEDTGTISLAKAPLEGFDFDLNNAPDLFPVVSVLAAFCAGTTHLSGVGRLAGKESDRAGAIVEMLTKMGVNVSVEGDVMTVEGETWVSRLLNGRLLKGGEYSSRHDHRMVMALKVASLGADGEIVIDDSACLDKSFPDFLEMFD